MQQEAGDQADLPVHELWRLCPRARGADRARAARSFADLVYALVNAGRREEFGTFVEGFGLHHP